MQGISGTLWADYCHYRTLTFQYKKNNRAVPRVTAERLALMSELATWCGHVGVEPRGWLYFLFQRRNFLHAPALKRSTLCSVKLVPAYHVTRLDHYFQTYTAESDRVDQAELAHVIDAGTEAIKTGYARRGDLAGCMVDPAAKGYHAKSFVCQRCPIAGQCYQALQQKYNGVDIHSVRCGLLSFRDAVTLRGQAQW